MKKKKGAKGKNNKQPSRGGATGIAKPLVVVDGVVVEMGVKERVNMSDPG
jgi:hypothetical protein